MFRFDCTFSNFNCTKRVQLHTILRPVPWRRPYDYHAICCIDGKTIQPLAVCTYLSSIVSELYDALVQKSLFLPHVYKFLHFLQTVSQHVPIYLQQFRSYSIGKCKKSPLSRTAAHIFVSPATITQYVAWMERLIQCLPNPSQHVPIYLQ